MRRSLSPRSPRDRNSKSSQIDNDNAEEERRKKLESMMADAKSLESAREADYKRKQTELDAKLAQTKSIANQKAGEHKPDFLM